MDETAPDALNGGRNVVALMTCAVPAFRVNAVAVLTDVTGYL
jgi:hypothetical protein